jgi:lipid-binding SYLF domain-containing protein
MKNGLKLTIAVLVFLLGSASAVAANKAQIDRDARTALNKLVAGNSGAKAISEKAVAVLVFPTIIKAGLMIGGQSGDGVLMRSGRSVAYYNTSGASYGLQAGAQTYGYAMFFMNQKALKQLDNNNGYEVGVGPSVVVADEGFGKSTTSITYDKDIYAFIFNQSGLMAGLGLQGNKITRIK